MLGGLQRFRRAWRVRRARYRGPVTAVIGAAVILAVVVAAPMTIERHERQVGVLPAARHVDALAAASAWIESELPEGAAVLTDVREGKWIEGLTGHPALFTQPVRYAFRPAEWQRSTDADALLRSTLTLTSGYVIGPVRRRSRVGSRAVPSALLLRPNHGGEFVDLLRLPPRAT